MTRFSARTTKILAAIALLSGASAVNCSKGGSTSGAGMVRLALVLPDATTINQVTYTVLASNGTTVLATGPINTSDPGATPSVDVSVIASMGDSVKLHAVTSANVVCDGTGGPFDVAAGLPTGVNVQLICGGSMNKTASGSLIVNGSVVVGDNCPVLNSWMASPLTSSTAGQIDVSAVATDADATDTVTYAWTATAGTFVAPGSATTKYNCSVGGAQTLTVTVSDNHGATPCTAVQTFPVTCVSLSCGNGVLDVGEACDSSAATDPNKANCDANCHLICGNGVVDVAAGEQCDPPVANICSATCKFVPSNCGDGVIQNGEQCDPPNGTTCSATCTSQSVDVNAGCQTCESTSANCDATLTSVPGAATFGCSGFTGTALTACNALLSCIRTNHCNNGDDPTPCFCGAQDSVTCLSNNGDATQPCHAAYLTALASVTLPGTNSVTTLFGNPKSPVGVANNIVGCDVDAHCNTAPLCGAF